MKDSDQTTNGAKAYELSGDKMMFYYHSGRVKAEGPYKNNLMEGEWRFFRENGQLWQTGNFRNGEKEGRWVRFDQNGEVEYDETFRGGKVARQ